MNKLSVVIIAGQEEHNIRACLESVSWADEIIVVCSTKSDRTMDIAREFTSCVHFREFDSFSSQRSFALSLASHEWILGVDADERILPDLKKEIQTILESPTKNGYRIPRRNYFLGKWMRHGGWYPDYQLRLVKKSLVRISDRKVHEGFVVDGSVKKLTHPMDHFTDPTILHHLTKNIGYSQLEALERAKRVRAIDLILHPIGAFITKFIGQSAWRDGAHGVAAALIHASCNLQQYLFMWELQQKKREG